MQTSIELCKTNEVEPIHSIQARQGKTQQNSTSELASLPEQLRRRFYRKRSRSTILHSMTDTRDAQSLQIDQEGNGVTKSHDLEKLRNGSVTCIASASAWQA